MILWLVCFITRSNTGIGLCMSVKVSFIYSACLRKLCILSRVVAYT
jgi:hypothetical protein